MASLIKNICPSQIKFATRIPNTLLQNWIENQPVIVQRSIWIYAGGDKSKKQKLFDLPEYYW